MSAQDFIEQQKKLYKTLKPCHCPAIQNVVHFNAEGIKHLLYEKHRPRNAKVKVYRSHLINHLTYVITTAQKATEKSYAEPPCRLWVLEWIEIVDDRGNKMKIKIILKKSGNGNVYF